MPEFQPSGFQREWKKGVSRPVESAACVGRHVPCTPGVEKQTKWDAAAARDSLATYGCLSPFNLGNEGPFSSVRFQVLPQSSHVGLVYHQKVAKETAFTPPGIDDISTT